LSTGFPLDKAAITEIFHSEYISTIDHLREEKALFTLEYFQEQKIPKVLSKILSEEIQKLEQLEATQQDHGVEDENNDLPPPPLSPKASSPDVSHSVRLRIVVKTTDLASISLDVDLSETVRTVKEKLYLECAIPVEQQRLVCGGREPDDTALLSSLQISAESALFVHDRLNEMKIVVKTETGKVLTVLVEPDDSIASVKQKVASLEGILPADQRLIFACRVMQDADILWDCHIEAGSTLHLVLRSRSRNSMQIFVKTSDDILRAMDVVPTDLVGGVKEQLRVLREGMDIVDGALKLFFAGRELIDTSSLSESGVETESTLFLVRRSKESSLIVEHSGGDQMSLVIEQPECLSVIKEKIFEREGIFPSQQALFHGCLLVETLGLERWDVPFLTLRPRLRGCLRLFAKTSAGATHVLEVKPFDTIGMVKEMIRQRDATLSGDFLLYSMHANFSDESSIFENRIANESVLWILQPSQRMQIFVRNLTERIRTFNVERAEAVSAFK
jgi:hypothetical protein